MHRHPLTLVLFSLLTIALAAVVPYHDPSSSNSKAALTLHARAHGSGQVRSENEEELMPGTVCELLRNQQCYPPHKAVIFLHRHATDKDTAHIAIITNKPSENALITIPTNGYVKTPIADNEKWSFEADVVLEGDLRVHPDVELQHNLQVPSEKVKNLMIALWIIPDNAAVPVKDPVTVSQPKQPQRPTKRSRHHYPAARLKLDRRKFHPLINNNYIFDLTLPSEQNADKLVSVAVLSRTADGSSLFVGADTYLPQLKLSGDTKLFLDRIRGKNWVFFGAQVPFDDIEKLPPNFEDHPFLTYENWVKLAQALSLRPKKEKKRKSHGQAGVGDLVDDGETKKKQKQKK